MNNGNGNRSFIFLKGFWFWKKRFWIVDIQRLVLSLTIYCLMFKELMFVVCCLRIFQSVAALSFIESNDNKIGGYYNKIGGEGNKVGGNHNKIGGKCFKIGGIGSEFGVLRITVLV